MDLMSIAEIDDKLTNDLLFAQDVEDALWEVRADAPSWAIKPHMESVLGSQWSTIIKRYREIYSAEDY